MEKILELLKNKKLIAGLIAAVVAVAGINLVEIQEIAEPVCSAIMGE